MAFAESCGACGMRAANRDELKEALEKAIALNKPVVIDAQVDGEVYANMNKSM